MNFYNEFDPFKCEWIQNLKDSSQIETGIIDGRSITEVEAAELVGYHQAHFFTGIAGWPKALQLAGYGGTAGIWTGSPPCQPFSVAGKRKGETDKRHLWPEFRRLITQCKPSIVFIEQVASKDGREWFARVRSDFKDLGYRVGAADLCSACIGAPHIRQRLYIGAVRIRDTNVVRQDPVGGIQERSGADGAGGVRGVRMADAQHDARRSADVNEQRRRGPAEDHAAECGRSGGMDNPTISRLSGSRISRTSSETRDETRLLKSSGSDSLGRMGHAAGERLGETRSSEDHRRESIVPAVPGTGSPDRLGDSISSRLEGHSGHESRRDEPGRHNEGQAGSTSPSGPWSDFRIIDCLDGKKRRVGTGIQPLAHGIPRGLGHLQPEIQRMAKSARSNRKGRLKGYGDAIVVPLAAMFITELFKALDHD